MHFTIFTTTILKGVAPFKLPPSQQQGTFRLFPFSNFSMNPSFLTLAACDWQFPTVSSYSPGGNCALSRIEVPP